MLDRVGIGVTEGPGVAEGIGVAEGPGVTEGFGVAEGPGVTEGFGVAEGTGVTEGTGGWNVKFQGTYVPDWGLKRYRRSAPVAA